MVIFLFFIIQFRDNVFVVVYVDDAIIYYGIYKDDWTVYIVRQYIGMLWILRIPRRFYMETKAGLEIRNELTQYNQSRYEINYLTYYYYKKSSRTFEIPQTVRVEWIAVYLKNDNNNNNS